MSDGIPLSEFLTEKKQSDVARRLGISQPGLRKMLISERNIIVEEADDGSLRAFETREVPRLRRVCNA